MTLKPKTLLECEPGDVVMTSEYGRIVVTGSSQGKSNLWRFCRQKLEDDREGEIFPARTDVRVVSIESLQPRGKK